MTQESTGGMVTGFDPGRTDRVAVLEIEPEGHRLQYLHHLVAAAGPDRGVVMTRASAAASPEYPLHVGDRFPRTVLPDADHAGTLAAAVDAALDAGIHRLVIPDGDRYLRPLLRLMLGRPTLRLGITILLMRTTEIGGPERVRPATVVKPALVQMLRAFPQVRLMFLTDAFGVVRRRHGFGGVLGVPDPVAAPSGDLRPDWLPPSTPGRTVVGVFGVVDERKNVPVLVDALRADPRLTLAIGGRVHPNVGRFLAAEASDLRSAGRLVVQDRLLTAPEFGGALAGVDAVAALHDNDAPSGVVAEACLRGTPVIVPVGGWLARVVSETGIGVATHVDGRSVTAAMASIATDPARFAEAIRLSAERLGTAVFTDALLSS